MYTRITSSLATSQSTPAAIFIVALLIATNLAQAAFVEQTSANVHFLNHDASLVITKSPCQLSLLDESGTQRFVTAKPLAFEIAGQWQSLTKIDRVESSGNEARLTGVLEDGRATSIQITPFGAHGFRLVMKCNEAKPSAVRGAMSLDPVEEIYGFGETWNGHVAQRGQALEIRARSGTPDECAYMPYYVSTKNYAWFLDYGGTVKFDMGRRRADEITFEAPTDTLTLTLVVGTNLPSTVQNFFSEIGLPARPPRWAFEPWFWLMGDPNQPGASIKTLRGEHFLQMIHKLRALNIPIGVTWFEPPWQTVRNSFLPNPQFHSNHKALIREINELGVRVLAWTSPYTTRNATNWQEATAHGYLVRPPQSNKPADDDTITASGELSKDSYNYVDFYNPEAFQWWQSQIDSAIALGFQGFKLDAGQDLPHDALLHGGRVGTDVRCSYAVEYNRVFFETLQRMYGDDFLMIPRAGWVGSSRFTNFKWPGDLSGSFANNGLPSSVYSSLSLAFSGYPFVSTDIGGFMDRPAPEHVWIRWAQFNAMLPGFQTLHMPWWYSDKAVNHFRYLAWLHTDMIPFWMSLANEAHATAAPVCRPLVWNFQDDVDGWRMDDEFMVGNALLAAPILNPTPTREVYLPPGSWFDFWDDRQAFTGPKTVTWFKGWEEGKWTFPLYVRAGAIIPMEISNDITGFGTAESKDCVTLCIWPPPSGKSSFTLHDREDPVAIEASRLSNGAISVSWGATKQNLLIRLHLDQVPGEVQIDRAGTTAPLEKFASLESFRASQADGWYYEAAKRKLWVRSRNNGSPAALTAT